MPRIPVKRSAVRSAARPARAVVRATLSGSGRYNYRPAAVSRYSSNRYSRLLPSRPQYNRFSSIRKSLSASNPRMGGSGGEYVITHSNNVLAPQVPQFSRGREDDSVVITHREYLGDIFSSPNANSFSIQAFCLNPGESATFPWLSNIAQLAYQQYKFEGLCFEYKSYSADALNSTNTALGSVFACINYDFSDTDMSSRYQVENTDWSQSCKPSESMLIPVECKPRQTGLGGLLYVMNSSAIPTFSDAKTYHLGKFFIGTTGFQGTSVNCGSLYVTYKVRLYKPLMTAPLSNADWLSSCRSGCTAALPLGTGFTSAALASGCDTLGCVFTGTTLTIGSSRLQVGSQYMVWLQWIGTSATVGVPTFTLSSNATGITLFGDNFSSTSYSNAGNTTTLMYAGLAFRVVAGGGITLTLGTGGTLPGAPCDMVIQMVQLNGTPTGLLGNFVGY